MQSIRRISDPPSVKKPTALGNIGSPPLMDSVATYVKRQGGTCVIEKVLIANNGIAGVKAIRSIRQWAYTTFGDENKIRFVAMATPEDLKANAEYIRIADQVEEVPGGANNNNYANVPLIVDIAERTHCHAVWAGWGHASENPALPQMLSETPSKIAFLGPAAGPMHDLGDKISSTVVAQSAGVPCVPWNGSGIMVDYAKDGITNDVFKKATVDNFDEALAAMDSIGYPVMIKASEGGGGKGIRKVKCLDDLEMAFRQVQSEVPGSPIFMMRLVSNCHHLEVQIVGDEYGEAIALLGRDCSVQRRHQKILEEGPAIAASADVWLEMEKAAVRLTKAVRYSGAGTVEYLFADGEFFFLELNPRLQVEHPVTEQITGINLPATQLNIAMGIPLHNIPEIRRWYGEDPSETTPIDFDTTSHLPAKGHVIAARITAENPDLGFKPTSGQIHELTFRSTPNVWGYFSVGMGGGLHEYADSQFGHLFSWGPARDDARRGMVLGLKELSIRGDIRTPVEFLVHILETEDFRTLNIHTEWLDSLIAAEVVSKKPDPMDVVICGSVVRAQTVFNARHEQVLECLKGGHIPSLDLLRIDTDVELIYNNVKYRVRAVLNSLNGVVLSIGNTHVVAEFRPLSDGGVLVFLDGKSHVCYERAEAAGRRLVMDGKTFIFSKEYDPTSLCTNTPGKLVRYLVADGSHVKPGTAYAEVEVMKMYLPLISQEAGIIHLVQQEGASLYGGCLIASLELDDPSEVKRAVDYKGELPKMLPPRATENKVHQKVRSAITTMRNVLGGYNCVNLDEVVDFIVEQLWTPELPLFDVTAALSAVSSRLPKPIVEKTEQLLAAFEAQNQRGNFPGAEIEKLLSEHNATLTGGDRASFTETSTPLMDLAKRYQGGFKALQHDVVSSFFKEYLSVETVFQTSDRDKVVRKLREVHTDDLDKVCHMMRSRNTLTQKHQLVLKLFDTISASDNGQDLESHVPILHEIASLTDKSNAEVSLRARQLLIRYQLPNFNQRKAGIEDCLRRAVAATTDEGRLENMAVLVEQSTPLFDVLVSFFAHKNNEVRKVAIETYIRRSYRAYHIVSTNTREVDGLAVCDWAFSIPHVHFTRSQFSLVTQSESVDDLFSKGQQSARSGLIVAFDDFAAMKANFDKVLATYEPESKVFRDEPINVLSLCIAQSTTTQSEAEFISAVAEFLCERKTDLANSGVRRVTLVVSVNGKFPSLYTFRQRLNFAEDSIYRNIEPPLAFHMELKRLSNFDIQLVDHDNAQIQLYYAEERHKSAHVPTRGRCLFARAMVRQGDLFLSSSNSRTRDLLVSEAERVLVEALEALEVAIRDPRYSSAQNNHIFLKVIPDVVIEPTNVDDIIRFLGARYGKRLWKLRVFEVEIALKLKQSLGRSSPIRFFAHNPSGYSFKVQPYLEVRDARTEEVYLSSVAGSSGPLDGVAVHRPYPVVDPLQQKRFNAQNANTTYVYDFPDLFTEALREVWRIYKKANPETEYPAQLLEAHELVLGRNDELKEVKRAPATNDIAMVAWRIKLWSPELPEGRELIVIANDITHQIGSFGPREDVLFQKASELARKRGLPRIYLAANSGARIGLAQEVRDAYKVEWVDPKDFTKGFQYLYLNDEDHAKLGNGKSVMCEKVEDIEDRWRITDIIGAQDGLGVENLRGSGMIAGETSRAYEEIFTLTLVTGRTVGIGAYLVRLGQRTIQNQGPVILTGAPALNKVLGRQVYTSNVQLGGPQIMFANGVSHLDVNDELKGITAILDWLAYVPGKSGAALPSLPVSDPVDRDIAFVPSLSPYDPRRMIAGYTDSSGEWVSGFFDRDSFIETLAGWAKTVVVGRARLGGIPIGVIAVETRTCEQVTPADPANPDSKELVSHQAGQVWFPDSAYKTAQSIEDFNNEELPLMIFANWRGFSGGMRDMFDEILKFGSYIVDRLRQYKRPVFVYLPPHGELRGGAWVVLDQTINPEMMEMYADTRARGGVLEASGTVEIKYRHRDLVITMHRLDPALIELDAKLKVAGISPEETAKLSKTIGEREESLFVTYQQIAIRFADLHDTPGRMKVKNVITDVVPWETSRTFFYHRLRRRVAERSLRGRIHTAFPGLKHRDASFLIVEWMSKGGAAASTDIQIVDWLESSADTIEGHLADLRKEFIKHSLQKLMAEDASAMLDGFLTIWKGMDNKNRDALLHRMQSTELAESAPVFSVPPTADA
eukprot:TRINITY_DN4861_c0_g2_i1.p1 TRINITY_DN4861_c0_g2~~TRINITY_DN4861_c0_g2_i1.p1  ORF type:complete len:2246 (+),score=745.03 TRINITY_DN4861_c0_g2_i1:121-6738(+)